MSDNKILSDFEFSNRPEGFDKHINDSIRNYSTLIDNTLKFSKYFVENNTNVYDLGASSGNLIKLLSKENSKHAPNAKYIGIDLEKKFHSEFNSEDYKNVELIHDDITRFRYNNASLFTSIFTLQFTPLSERQDIVNNVYQSLNQSGALIIAEKTMSPDSRLQDIMTSTYHEFKRNNFTSDDILDKEEKLRYMMKPQSEKYLVNMLDIAGFKTYQSFWKSYNFVGYIAIK